MILVTASTGHLGRLVLDELRTKVDPSTIVATARRPEALADLAAEGVVARELDYDRPDSVSLALTGVTQVLLISGSDVGRRVPQHQAVIDAAIAAGVEHLAYTSVLHADTSSVPVAPEHLATEQLLAAAPLTTTILRHGWYVENYTERLEPSLANGAFVGSAGEGRIAAATRADFAAADVAVLVDPTLRGSTYELAGPAFTMSELAAAVSALAGRDLPYHDMPAEQYGAILSGAGLPEPLVQFLVATDLSIAAGGLDASSETLERLIGRAPTTLTTALQALTWDA
ncbi:MAG TPA: NAD(P)H-binding protein [Ilumatobacter sp.]|nr:NAD(P)H-binding protein [Ilumatobacter sp.]